MLDLRHRAAHGQTPEEHLNLIPGAADKNGADDVFDVGRKTVQDQIGAKGIHIDPTEAIAVLVAQAFVHPVQR